MSDSDSRDSDEGIRFKTESVRNRIQPYSESYHNNYSEKYTSAVHTKITDKKRKHDTNEDLSSSNDRNISKKVVKISSPIDTFSRNSDEELSGSNFKPDLPSNFKQVSKREVAKDEPTIIGPAFPPHLLNINQSHDVLEQIHKNRSEAPTKQPVEDIFVGPKLPHHLLQKHSKEKEENRDILGPKLPPSFQSKIEIQNRIVGPALPSYLSQNPSSSKQPLEDAFEAPKLSADLKQKSEEASTDVLGPKLPFGFQNFSENHNAVIGPEDEDEEFCGPLPSGMEVRSKAHQALEERALQLKIEQLEPKSKEPVRETWMLELPEAKATHFDLGPRQFRSKEGPDLSDRSSWTDTPRSKNKKEKPAVNLQQEAASREIKKRNKEQELLAKKHKVRDKSLIEIHQEKLKHQQQMAGPSERRPFSRETDLQINKFDEAQKKAVLKKAQMLDDRFSTGKAKYL